jgi:outer membrane lipoprotein-sorting protein
MRSLIFAAVLVIATSPTARAESVDAIIAKHVEARGGDKLRGVQTLRMAGKLVVGPGLEAPFALELKKPGRLRFEVVIQGMTIVQAVEGDTGWTIQPMTGKKDAERMTADDLKEIQDQADFEGPLVDYKKKGHKVELVGKEKVEGTDVYKLKVTKKNGDIETIYLDADAFLEIKSEGKRVVRDAPVEFSSTTGDYKPVSGVMFPFSTEFGIKGQKVKLSFAKIEVNAKVDDARFKMPAPAADAKPAPAADPKPAPTASPRPAPAAPAPAKGN